MSAMAAFGAAAGSSQTRVILTVGVPGVTTTVKPDVAPWVTEPSTNASARKAAMASGAWTRP